MSLTLVNWPALLEMLNYEDGPDEIDIIAELTERMEHLTAACKTCATTIGHIVDGRNPALESDSWLQVRAARHLAMRAIQKAEGE